MIREYIMHIVTSYNKKQTLYDYLETTDIIRNNDIKDIRHMARSIFDEDLGEQQDSGNDKYFNFKIERHRALNDRIEDAEKRMRIYREMKKFMEYSKMIEDAGDIEEVEVIIEIVKEKGQ